jgi:hydrogenase maturation factor
VGSYVIVHAGFATGVLPEREALEAIEYTRQLNAVGSRSTSERAAIADGP